MSVCERRSSCTPHAGGRALGGLAGLLLAFVVAVSGMGCEPGRGVTYENRTNHTVTVFRDGVRDFVLKPSEKQHYSEFKFTGSSAFEARDEIGRVVYSETLTWDELKRRGWKIVITEAAPTGGSPAPAETAPAWPSPQ